MRHIILIFALISLLTAVYFAQKKLDNSVSVPHIPSPAKFQIPKIVGAGLELNSSQERESIIWVRPLIIGKYPFQAALKLEEKIWKGLDETCPQYKSYDEISGNGLRVAVDYLTTIPDTVMQEINYSDHQKFFPAYLLNESSLVKLLDNQVDLPAMIEAKDEKGWWYPIQSCLRIGWCGRGRYPLEVHPGEMLVFAMPKFRGEFKTELRVRVRIGSDILTSDPFIGWINPKQFHFEDNSMVAKEFEEDYKHSPYGAIYSNFNGSIPKDYRDKY